MIDVGLALPTMATGWTRRTWIDWCRTIDDGPFSSVSCGERITFHNVEMLTTLAGAAALTERARVFVNLAIAPWHATTLLAKQLATLDVLCDGRLDVGLGVGGREQDYASLGASMARRHARLDQQVGEIRRLWAGEPAVDGAPPLGPPVVQPNGPRLLAGAMGPKATARAALWAEGVSGFSMSLDPREIGKAVDLAKLAWTEAGRDQPPRIVIACFYALGADAPAVLRGFTNEYLAVFGPEVADAMAATATLSSVGALTDALEAVRNLGTVDEVVLVPATVDLACAELAAGVVAGVMAEHTGA